jgi:hypothetical protein
VRRISVVSLAAACLAGCGSQQLPQARPSTLRVPLITPTTTTATVAPYSPPELAADPVTCGSSPAVVTAGPIEAALGHRYLALTLKNCGDTPIRLQGRPVFEVADASGDPLATTFAPDQRQAAAIDLEAGGTAYLGLDWRIVSRGDASESGHELTVIAPGVGRHVLRGVLDIDADTEVRVGPWVAARDDTFPS